MAKPPSGIKSLADEHNGTFWVEKEIRHVRGVADRVSSGPVRFGADWPGTFVRGDHSANLADMLRSTARLLRNESRLRNASRRKRHAEALDALARTFGLCSIEQKDGPNG